MNKLLAGALLAISMGAIAGGAVVFVLYLMVRPQ